MGGVNDKTLQSGAKVQLATWEDVTPPTHGPELSQRAWNASNSRDGMAFYESTVQYMRNDWAAAKMPMVHGHLDGKDVVLFHGGVTNTWHTADALDIDHATPWKAHLTKLGVNNVADAQMAYNDVSNLRMLPSIHNRARDSADTVLQTHGPQSQQWKAWVENRFSFDNTIQYQPFDPEKDSARRTKVTLNQPWTEDNTRSELSFDKRVMEVWFNKELDKNFAGKISIDSPDKSQHWDVPLFKCAATGQLVTRDALDIDHAIPFEQLVKKMHELHPEGFSKADALDAYNDTSNLRLVGRSANSSHEWELMPDGHFRDKVEPEIPGEFKKFIVEDGQMSQGARTELQQAIRDMRDGNRMMVEQYWSQQGGAQQGGPTSGSPSSQPLVNQPGHPDNLVFQKVVGDIAKLDPGEKVFTASQRESMASSLMVAAKHEGLPGIDHVVWNKDKTSLVAVSGQLDSPTSRISWMEPQQGMHRTIEQNTEALSQIAQRQQQTTPTQTPHTQHAHYL